MTTEAKLERLFLNKQNLNPLTDLVISHLQQAKINRGFELDDPDVEYIEHIYPVYFGESNERL